MEVCKTEAREAMKVVYKFVYLEVIILTFISILPEAVAQRCSVKKVSVKKVFLEISQNLQEKKNHSLTDFGDKRDCVCLMINL